MGKIDNLVSAGEADQLHPSTGAVESEEVVIRKSAITTAVGGESEWCQLEDLLDEICMLFHHFKDAIKKNFVESRFDSHTATCTKSGTCAQKASFSSRNSGGHTETQPTGQQNQAVVRKMFSLWKLKTWKRRFTTVTTRRSEPHSQDIQEVDELFKKAINSKYWNNPKEFKRTYIRIEDTGGQPELMDILPAFTIGPYFLPA